MEKLCNSWILCVDHIAPAQSSMVYDLFHALAMWWSGWPDFWVMHLHHGRDLGDSLIFVQPGLCTHVSCNQVSVIMKMKIKKLISEVFTCDFQLEKHHDVSGQLQRGRGERETSKGVGKWLDSRSSITTTPEALPCSILEYQQLNWTCYH